MTLRHFPQSFEYSTLGGWIATRAGGHFATGPTHIDDLVESVRAITPAGAWESRRLPGSGAGPSPDRMLIGSEGILGVITEAWVRVRPRPVHKLSCGVSFDSFHAGAEAVRELAQSGLNPANCRLLDPEEAQTTQAPTTARRCSSSASSPPTIRSTSRCGSRSRRCAGTAVGRARSKDPHDERRIRPAAAETSRRSPVDSGATPSSPRPISATRSWPAR